MAASLKCLVQVRRVGEGGSQRLALATVGRQRHDLGVAALEAGHEQRGDGSPSTGLPKIRYPSVK